MKKTILASYLFIMIMMCSAINLNAQQQVFKKADKDLSFGLGFGSSWITSGYSSVVPPIVANFDYGLRDDWGPGVFGVGGYLGTSFYRTRYTNYITGDKYGTNYTTFIIAARATYHYTFVDKLDTYGGALLGFRLTPSSEYGSVPYGIVIDPDNGAEAVDAIFVGAKYYFADNFSAYSEVSLGWGVPYITFGVTLKF